MSVFATFITVYKLNANFVAALLLFVVALTRLTSIISCSDG